ncbi:sensor histidine kinase [Tindallia californiensis]|nr:ATP-binding protein [Tindallia californiensis]
MVKQMVKQMKQLGLVALLIGIASQFYLNFYITNFHFSFAAILFPVIIYLYDEINPFYVGVASSLSFFLFRLMAGQQMMDLFPEMTFYLLYGGIFFLAKKVQKPQNMEELFLLVLFSDFFGNVWEVYLRIGSKFFTENLFVLRGLLLAALIRASIAMIIIIAHKHYRMFLIREEHEERYKKLLWFTARLKTEVYWMEKNMDHIEKVMSRTYQLFTNISEEKERENWKNQALDICKNIHEIKKEYDVVVRGVESVLENQMVDPGIHFHELIQILKESMEVQIQETKKNITLHFRYQEDFYTKQHYYLMSVLRNLITNAMEAIPKQGNILVTHYKTDNDHCFMVQDNGVGIVEEDRPHIFNPGFSSKIDYQTGEVNRGLGLSLVNNIVVDGLKGRIRVHSKENKETCFEVFIPVGQLEGDENENISVG